ncbi:MAG: amino acid adenylation domain-containing protein [Selenomonadaceae bacterium]|nr:amino acid adenylation domain-containing protein [Selenomonadaceae bacterium]
MQKINVIDYLKATVEKYPNKKAITDKNGTITFNELYNQAVALANVIIKQTNYVHNKPIAVLMPKCKECIIVFMAIVMSGNFYCPIDTKMPDNRKQKIIDSLKPALVVRNDNKSLVEYECSDLFYDVVLQGNDLTDDNLVKQQLSKILSIDPLYVLFTSGSTGIPKGVVVSHAAVIDFVQWTQETFRFSSSNVLANQAPFYFDNSVLDIYNMVLGGSSLVILDEALFLFPEQLFECLCANNVDTIFWAPSALISVGRIFSNECRINLPSLKNILYAGEVMAVKHISLWMNMFEDALFANLYGPTEATDICIYYKFDRTFDSEEVIPIGKPCRNMEIIIYDEEKQCVSANNEIGEILVRGIGLSKGYYKDMAKTNTAFIQNPLHNDYIDLVYKTGDLGKICDDGNIIYVGRKDNQVKIQGYRIELGEIEHVATCIDGVSKACAIATEDQKLVLLVETSSNKITQKGIYQYLKNNLPKYMLPAEIIIWDGEFPLNQNGKIDRVRLKYNINN